MLLVLLGLHSHHLTEPASVSSSALLTISKLTPIISSTFSSVFSSAISYSV